MLLFSTLLLLSESRKGSGTCGTPNEGELESFGSHAYFKPRIMQGDRALMGSWPWTVRLDFSTTMCTGVLIGDRWVLTAAHCEEMPARVYYGSVVYNDMKKLDVKRFIVHGGYAKSSTHDIALAELEHPLDIEPICLSRSARPKTDDIVFATGYGLNFVKVVAVKPSVDTLNVWPDYLRETRIQVRNSSFCGFTNTDLLFCAGGVGTGTNSGDSGGPVFTMHNGTWTLIGLTSSGYNAVIEGEQFSIEDHGNYVTVPSYCNWIAENTNGEVVCGE